MNLQEDDIKLLNSKIGLKHLFAHEEVNVQEALQQTRYELRLRDIQAELVKLQSWVIEEGKKLVVLFHGSDPSEKSGIIRTILGHNNPRHYRIEVHVPSRENESTGEWYFQKYAQQLPYPGEMVFFDRSWYNRAIIEPVLGLCTEKEYERFMKNVNDFEKLIVDSGIILVKFYFTISKKEQERRLKATKADPLTKWKIEKYDEDAHVRWSEYLDYKDKMFAKTNTALAPWWEIKADRREEELIEAAEHLLKICPYQSKDKD